MMSFDSGLVEIIIAGLGILLALLFGFYASEFRPRAHPSVPSVLAVYAIWGVSVIVILRHTPIFL